MIYVAILAGGKTLYNNIPLHFALLGDKPILVHTIESFLVHPIENVKFVITVARDWKDYTRKILKKHVTADVEIELITGGENKNSSILNTAQYIKETHGVLKDDILLCHDAIRPFISYRIIDDNITLAMKHGATNTVLHTTDTIVRLDDGNVISDIPPRESMYAEQTPQTFNIELLMSAMEKVGKRKAHLIVDTAMLLFVASIPVYGVKGDSSNFKILTPYDIEVAKGLLKGSC